MITVGVRSLKNQLSQYLQYVKNGEKVVITEHNKIIAEINVPKQDELSAAVEEKLVRQSKEGDIILAKRSGTYVKLPKISEKLDWKSAYNEVRSDRI